MRKVYCDMCGNKYETTNKINFIEPYFDYLQGHCENKNMVKILLLIFKNFDLCDGCQKWWEIKIQKITEGFETEQEVRETTSDNKDVKEKSPDNE